MNANRFDPADWIERWREAGGGWSDTDLLRMKSSGDLRALTALSAELNGKRRRAVLDHLKATDPGGGAVNTGRKGRTPSGEP